MNKLKWISIAIVLVLICVFLTSFIPNGQMISPILGFVIGFWCMNRYLEEDNEV